MLSESPSMEQTPQFPSIEQKNSEIYQSYMFVTNKLCQSLVSLSVSHQIEGKDSSKVNYSKVNLGFRPAANIRNLIRLTVTVTWWVSFSTIKNNAFWKHCIWSSQCTLVQSHSRNLGLKRPENKKDLGLQLTHGLSLSEAAMLLSAETIKHTSHSSWLVHKVRKYIISTQNKEKGLKKV